MNLDWEPTADAADDSAQVDYVEPSEDARIFVGNLPFDVDSENLATLFDQAGTVEIAQVSVTHTLFNFQFVNAFLIEFVVNLLLLF